MTKETVYEGVKALVAEEAGVTVENLTLAKRGAYKKVAEAAMKAFEAEYAELQRKAVEEAYERAVERGLLDA